MSEPSPGPTSPDRQPAPEGPWGSPPLTPPAPPGRSSPPPLPPHAGGVGPYGQWQHVPGGAPGQWQQDPAGPYGHWQPPGGPGGPQFAASPQAPGPRRKVLITGALLGITVLLVVGGWAAWSVLRDDGPGHPDEWDPRVLHLVDYVEDHGGRPFEHPVHIHFLPDEEFRAEVTSDEADLTDDDLEAIAQAEAQMRALGLVDGDFDLFEGQNDLRASGILAYYDPESKSVTVRGTDLSLDVEVTVVHELVHAWQDQLVDLMEVEESLEDDAFIRYRAVVEGHAVNVEHDYVADELDEAERDEYFATSDEEVDAVADDAPAVLVAMMAAPYALGPSFVGVVAEDGGDDAVVDLLRSPPSSLEQLFDPRLFLDGVEPVEVDVMDLPDGAEPIDEGGFEVLELYLVLASRLDAADALNAADGWAGGSYVAYEDSDGTVCVGVRIEADSTEARQELVGALETWAGHLPSASVTAPASPTTVEVTSCDPGDHRSEEAANRVDEALIAPALRLVVMRDLMVEGIGDVDESWCVADGVVDQLTSEELAADEPTPRVQGLVIQVMGRCGVSF